MWVLPIVERVKESDARIALRVQAWRPPAWLCVTTVAATRMGDGWAWAALAVLLFTSGDHLRPVLTAAVLAGFAASFTFVLIKRRIRRPRPCDRAPHPVFRVRAPDRFSFPSGHTINAFAICGVVAHEFAALTPLLTALAAGIGASRVVLGLHYVSDVVVGAVLGLLIAGAIRAVVMG